MNTAFEHAVVSRNNERILFGTLDGCDDIGVVQAFSAFFLVFLEAEGLTCACDAAVGACHNFYKVVMLAGFDRLYEFFSVAEAAYDCDFNFTVAVGNNSLFNSVKSAKSRIISFL